LGARSSLLEELSELDAKKAKLVAQRGRELLENAQAYLTNAGVEQVSTKLRNAEIIETIADYESTTDLIVLGKRGMGADYDKMHLGSNLERVARSSQKPVLVASRVIRPIKRFMIAFDGGNSVWKASMRVAIQTSQTCIAH
jgi:nucleotide-binding universal stress UspA family protein